MAKNFILIDSEELELLLKKCLAEYFPSATVSKSVSADMPTKYCSRDEVCDMAHISYSTLWRMEQEGLIKKIKVGRRNLYLNSDIEDLLASGSLHTRS